MLSSPMTRPGIPALLITLAISSGVGGYAWAEDVNIYANTEYQTVRGFGGMSGVGWITDLTSGQVDTAFGSDDGQIGLSIMRMRIDPDSNNWSIQLPSAQRAVSHGAILLATPWTPPAYMKSNNSLTNGGKLLAQYYSAYTDHLLGFANYMSANGAPVYAMSLQNEPDWQPDYESCEWSASDFTDFLINQGSRFGDLNVLAPESLGFNHAYSDPFLNSATAAPQVDIVGGHLYGATPQDYPLARNKGKELWMTEHITNTEAANDWTQAMPLATELHESMAANFNAYIWWYIRRSYGLITEDGNVSKRGYIMSQYARFVRPGYVRVGATETPQSGVYVTAYKGPDNQYVIVAINTNTSHQNMTLNLHNASVDSFVKYSTSETLNAGYGGTYDLSNNSASVWIEPQSIATFVSQGSGSGDTSSGSNSIVVRMRGTSGDEVVNLLVGGTVVDSWTLTTTLTDYTVATDIDGEIRVAFSNDASGRDVQVDYVVVNGEIRQAEDQDDNTGVWGNGACGGGSYSEWLHCNGSIGFGSTVSDTATSTAADDGSSTSAQTDSAQADAVATVSISNDWNGGYCADLTVTNGTDAVVTWSVDVAVDGTVDSLWNADWSQTNDILHVSGLDWNSTLQPGQSISSIGFCASR